MPETVDRRQDFTRPTTHPLRFRPVLGAFTAVALLVVVGCDGSGDAPVEAEAAGQQYLLSEPPADPLSVTEASEMLSEPGEVTLVGRIDAGDFEPFEAGKATFVLSELPDDSHGAGDPDHADNCPFCKRKLANAPKALVQFVDDAGKVLPLDAQKAFGVQKQDVVVVHGQGEFRKDVGMVRVNADSLYVR